MITILTQEVDRFVFTTPASAPPKRRWNLERLEVELAPPAGPAVFDFEPDFDRALERVQEGAATIVVTGSFRSEEHTSELQSLAYLVCRLLLEKKKHPHSANHKRQYV